MTEEKVPVKISDVKRLYQDAVDYLDENFAYFLTHVLHLGNPRWSHEIPTCAVALDKNHEMEDHKFHYLMNPEFVAGRTPEQMAFLMGHEAMHIKLDHLRMAQDYPDKFLWNMAGDCVINDFLDESGLEPLEDSLRGETTVGYNCAYTPISVVYSDLEQIKKDNPELFAQLEAAMNASSHKHEWIHDPDPDNAGQDICSGMANDGTDLPSSLDDVKDDKQSDGGLRAGSSTYDIQGKISDVGISMNWAKLLEKVDPDIFRTPGIGKPIMGHYRRQPRKLMSVYPDLPLANYERDDFWDAKTDEIPSMVMALDVSGSISQNDVNRFVTLAKSIPTERIKLHVITFNSGWREVDQETWDVRVGGGTDFGAIEDYVRNSYMPENDDKYPKAIVVMTDGDANFPTAMTPAEDNQESWFWLLIQDGWSNWQPENFVQKFFGQADTVDNFVKGK